MYFGYATWAACLGFGPILGYIAGHATNWLYRLSAVVSLANHHVTVIVRVKSIFEVP